MGVHITILKEPLTTMTKAIDLNFGRIAFFAPMRMLVFLFSLLALSSCSDETGIPRPRGYFRIDLPEKNYTRYSSECPFEFDLPTYSQVVVNTSYPKERCWLNLEFPSLKATLHLSYKDVDGNASALMDESYMMAYKHSVKANGIRDRMYTDEENRVFGMLYSISGNSASSLQFAMTDSSKHFLRGSLYFYAIPNADSLAPVLDFVTADVDRMISSLRWKN